ncbi:MAG: three-Cys-motif partner protein TcmP [Proteocatella sp.]
MANNNSKVISHASPHTVKKFELIESYIKSWAQKLMLTKNCTGIIFIDCMCNSGVYEDGDKETVYGTPIRVANALIDVARTYPSKQVHLYFNDNDTNKIKELKKHIPADERNFKVITTTKDGNELLKFIGPQLNNNSFMHYFLLYDPYDASIDWEALTPFLNHWGEVLINHMISDSIRAISQVKDEKKKKKYTGTYRAGGIEELIPFGSDKSAYEKRILEIIQHIKGSSTSEYYVATFPFFNKNNTLVYDLVHCTNHKKGFKLFKERAWKTFGDKSSTKRKQEYDGQLAFDVSTGETIKAIADDEYCYDENNMAAYVQENFKGQKDVIQDTVWELLDNHPIFASDGYKNKIKKILKDDYSAEVSLKNKTITFANRRG